jgi:selenocysteine lyase/cysteine desulfurase
MAKGDTQEMLKADEAYADFIGRYPTGVGTLLVRRSVFAKLKRSWLAGGTIHFASVQGEAHLLSPAELLTGTTR